MMAQRGFVSLLLMVVLAACGKPQLAALQGESGEAGIKTLSLEDQSELESAVVTDGTLGPLSDFDLKVDPLLAEAGLPFLDEAGPEKSFSTFRKPRNGNRKVKLKDKAPLAYATHSNLVFRSIRQLPPKAAIQSVKSFKLKLNGFRVFAQDGVKPERGQSLCILDGKICVGETPEMSKDGGSGGNPKFWVGATVHGVDFLGSSSLKEISKTEDGGALFSSDSGGVEIDLLRSLNLSEKAAIEFLFKNSDSYSNVDAGFRKFRFSLGDRILADGGELILDLEVNAAAVPEGYEKRLPAPMHGASDMVNLEAKRKKRIMKDLKKAPEGECLLILDQADIASSKISRLSSKLSLHRAEIESIRVVSLSAEKASEEMAQTVKSELLKSGFTEQSIVMVTKIEEGAAPSVGIAVKFVAAIEKDSASRAKIMEDLRKEDSANEESRSDEVSNENADLP
jgi:hypothetical protein